VEPLIINTFLQKQSYIKEWFESTEMEIIHKVYLILLGCDIVYWCSRIPPSWKAVLEITIWNFISEETSSLAIQG